MHNSAGAMIHWNTSTIPYQVMPDNQQGLQEEGVVQSIQAAAQTWNASLQGAELRWQGEASAPSQDYADANVIFFATQWEFDSGLLAFSEVWSEDSGNAVAFDMPINQPLYSWGIDGESDKIDLQNTITHEFGHVLGVAHLPDDPDATMFPSAPTGETIKRDLDESDLNCLATLYTTENTPSVSNQFPLGCSSSPIAGMAVIPLSLLLLLRRFPSGV